MSEETKSGKEFEELVTWIHRSLNEKAVITPNDKIRDIHSNQLRQVDISIRMKDGPIDFLGIVEVRDRSRPVGEDYLEQISAKCKSVGADAAFIISSSGFYSTAVEKARALNIRIFTYEEAVKSDWMQCLQLTEITQFIRRWDNVKVRFLEPTSNQMIIPHQSVIDALRADLHALVIVNENGEPKFSIPNLAAKAIEQNIEALCQAVTFGDRQRNRAIVNLEASGNEPQLFFRDKTGDLRRLSRFYVEADFWMEVQSNPVQLSKYSNASTGEALAEVASTTIEAWGGTHKLQLIAKFAGENGTQVSMRLQKQTPEQS